MSNEDKVDFIPHYVNDAWAFLYSMRYSLLRADIHVHTILHLNDSNKQ